MYGYHKTKINKIPCFNFIIYTQKLKEAKLLNVFGEQLFKIYKYEKKIKI